MRIGIFTDTYFPQVSGVATSIRVLKEDLERQGHKVIIFYNNRSKGNGTGREYCSIGKYSVLCFQGSSCGDSRSRKSLPNCERK